MLEIRPNCECCDVDLAPNSNEVLICSFECTFCLVCADTVFNFICPNCGGELIRRPIRPEDKLVENPPSSQRVFNPNHRINQTFSE